MNTLHAGESTSIWLDTKSMPEFPQLKENLKTDVCVVGGGIAGLTTAYLLMKEGKNVCVLESFELASGQTGRTTAHFTTVVDDRYFDLEKYHGAKGARLTAESHRGAIQKVEEIIQAEKIECEIQHIDGYLFAFGDKRPQILEREFEAAVRAGLTDVVLLEKAPLSSFNTGTCLRFPKQVEIHPLKYLDGLAKCILQGGGKIFTNTHVTHVKGGEKGIVETKHGFTVNCDSIVVATNTPINDLFAIHTKQAAYRTYVVAFRIPKDSIPKGLYWDTLDPYHYIRIESGSEFFAEDILIVGGEDHKTGQEDHPEFRYERLETWTREKFPMAGGIVYQWSGQVMETTDGLAFLGRNPLDYNNVYVITGDSGNGMTHCTIGAMLITDQIMDRKNPWEELYSPSRISLRATPKFFRENANVVAQYADWLTSKPQISDLESLVAKEGLVIRDGLKITAAYKNENGMISLFSAACPHLGGVVHWNSAEKSWDCPCHGARFDCHGKVIEGPASSNLKLLDANFIQPDYPDPLPLQTVWVSGGK